MPPIKVTEFAGAQTDGLYNDGSNDAEMDALRRKLLERELEM